MLRLIKTLPVIAALVVTPAFAAAADQHAAHHAKGKAAAARAHKSKAKTAEMGCPMMQDHAAQAGAPAGGHMHCMDQGMQHGGGADAKPPPADAAPHDHDHPQPK